MARHYRYISADGHFESPPEQWTHRVPKQYRDRAPRRIKLANGRDGLLIEGRPLVYGGTSLYGGRAPEDFDPTVLDFDSTPGCGSAEQRLREQDEDGIDAEVLFALDVRNPAIRDKAAFLGIIQGFNDYLAEEYCAVERDRLIGVAVLPNVGVEVDIAEMTRCKRMGLKAVWLSTFPSGQSSPSAEDDRFWAAALDLEMPPRFRPRWARATRGSSNTRGSLKARNGRRPTLCSVSRARGRIIRVPWKRVSWWSQAYSIVSRVCRSIGPRTTSVGCRISTSRSIMSIRSTGSGRNAISDCRN
jgi:transcriptional regulator with XRE-family HTH domain